VGFHSEIEVESGEFGSDLAKLRVRREESVEMGDRGRIAGNLTVAAVFAALLLRVVSGGEQAPLQSWGLLIAYASGFAWFIRRAFSGGPRSVKQTRKAHETWRWVDGRWLLVEEEQLD